MGIGKLYLVVYNFVLAAAWAAILYKAASCIGSCSSSSSDVAGEDLVPEWSPIGRGLLCVVHDGDAVFEMLKVYQTAAALEILHAVLGLVKSKVSTTAQQVFSRVMLVWAAVYIAPVLTSSYCFFNMVFAWSITETVRYSWYGLKLALGDAPRALTWCRYTFFFVLYPYGVWSELCCISRARAYYGDLMAADDVSASANTTTAAAGALLATLALSYDWIMWGMSLLYIPLFPGLYLHMVAQRKKVIGARKPRPPMTEGIQFPADAKTGKRSTSATGQAVFAASVFNADPQAALRCAKERSWRFGYEKHVVENVRISCRDTETCLSVAKSGLDFVYDNFEFVRNGESMSMRQAMDTITDTFPDSLTVEGTGSRPEEFGVPYRRKPYPATGSRNNPLETLTGEDLKQQLDAWAAHGTIEPSARDAIKRVVDNKGWTDLSDKHFVLLGAGSAMGPLQVLLALGAHVIAIDLDRPQIWERLIKLARESPGKMTFPLKKKRSQLEDDAAIYAAAGSNMFTTAPEICNWLAASFKGKDLVIGGYAYLDGELHVRVSLAMDSIMAGVAAARPAGSVTLAYLCSPTDVFVCDAEARQASQDNLRATGFGLRLLAKVMRLLNPKKFFKSNVLETTTGSDGKSEYCIVDGLAVDQGPNYALAKRIQHWRAMLAFSQGTPVSSNIAPSTATLSVVHNKLFALAYAGFPYFKPMWVSWQETSNAVMGALLVHDVCNPKSKANPKASPVRNPVDIFKSGAFHGGVWRCGYQLSSIGEACALLHLMKKAAPVVVAGVVAGTAAALGILSQQ